jgi:hypothetical protein
MPLESRIMKPLLQSLNYKHLSNIRVFGRSGTRQLHWLHPIIAQIYHMKLLPAEMNLA